MAQTDLSAERLSYPGEELRRDDPDRFLASLFAPLDRRESLWAVWAFNLEVAKTRERVREPLLGQIRLQWWRDAVAEIYDGKPREHAVVTALAAAVHRHCLPRETLEQLIDAREADLSAEPPATLEELEGYAARSAGPPLALAMRILGVEASLETCRRIAAPQALVGLMLAMPYRALHGRVDLPADYLSEEGLVPEAVADPSARAAVARLARRVADRANVARMAALEDAGKLPRAARPALLTLTVAKRQFRRLRDAGFDPFNRRLGRRDGGRALAFWWSMRSGWL